MCVGGLLAPVTAQPSPQVWINKLNLYDVSVNKQDRWIHSLSGIHFLCCFRWRAIHLTGNTDSVRIQSAHTSINVFVHLNRQYKTIHNAPVPVYGRLINFQLERFRSSGELTKWQIGWHPRMKRKKYEKVHLKTVRFELLASEISIRSAFFVESIECFGLTFSCWSRPFDTSIAKWCERQFSFSSLHLTPNTNSLHEYETHAPLKLLFDPI